jgi:PAS domain S-box-containing protein
MIGLVLLCILSAIFITTNANKDISYLNTKKNHALEFRNKWLTFTSVNKSLLITDISEPVFHNLLDKHKRILAEITKTISVINSEIYLKKVDKELSDAYRNIHFIWDLSRDNFNHTRMLLESDLLETIYKKAGYGSVIEIKERLKAAGNTREHLKLNELINRILSLSSANDSFSNSLGKLISVIDSQITKQELLTQKTLLFVSLFLVLFAAISLLLIGNQIVKNIKTVEHAIRAVASGDFSIRLNINTHDEFRTLSENFNLFFHELGKNVESIQKILKTFGSAISEKIQFNEILELIAERAFQDTNANGVALMLVDDTNEYLTVKALKGSFDPLNSISNSDEIYVEVVDDSFWSNRFNFEENCFGEPVLTGKPVFFNDTDKNRWNKIKNINELSDIHSMMMTPLIVEGKPIGVIVLVDSKISSHLTDLDYTNIQTFTDFASLTIENFNRYQDMVADLNQEIEERTLVEDALRKSEQYNRMLFEDSIIGLALCKMNGELVDINSAYASILGRTVEETKTLSYWDITPEKYAKQEQEQLNKLKKMGRYGPYEKEYIHADGHLVPVRLSGLILEKDGTKFIWSSVEDITKRKQTESEKEHLQLELQQSQKMEALGKLTGGIAHEYNNMLAIIIGFSELLKSELKENPKLIKYTGEILKAGNRGAMLTSKLLTFSRQKVPEADSVNLNMLLQKQSHMLEKTLTVRINFILKLQDDLWQVWLDSGDMSDVILNLCINAMHAMEGSGQLTIQTSNQKINHNNAQSLGIEAGDYILLSITDTGCGIDKETQKKIFDPFFSTKGDKGTGLGLSMVYGFVQNSGGDIKVDSKLGEGTRFDLYFPRYYGGSGDQQIEEKNDYEDTLMGNETILVVDDEESLLNLTREILDSHGFNIIIANSAREALNILENNSIDILISDIIMPEMDGYQLASIVKEKYPDIKIQLASGFSDNDNMDMVDDDLQQNLLFKPFNSQALLQRIRELINEK